MEIDFVSAPPVQGIEAAEGVANVTAIDGNRITCSVHGSFEALLNAIAGHGVLNLVSREPTLEEVFLVHYRDEEPAEPAAS